MTDIPHGERLRRSRPWFKVWARHTLYGTTFNELPAVPRACWFSLLCLACDSMEPGIIGEGLPITIGYTDAQLAVKLKLSTSEIAEGRRVLTESGKITVDSNGVIRVPKWQVYQSDYDRTKRMPSQRRKPTPKPTPKPTAPDVQTYRRTDVQMYPPYPPKGDETAPSDMHQVQNDIASAERKRKVQEIATAFGCLGIEHQVSKAYEDGFTDVPLWLRCIEKAKAKKEQLRPADFNYVLGIMRRELTEPSQPIMGGELVKSKDDLEWEELARRKKEREGKNASNA